MRNHESPRRIKVCGIRDPGEAEALDALGIGWIGFNFHPASARYITPEAAAPIIRSLRNSVPVGVFVDASPERVAEIAALTGIAMAQLHGSESWETVQAMPLPVIKAIPHTRLADLAGLRASLVAHGPGRLTYLLVDTQAKTPSGPGPVFGGTGEAFDWALLKAHPLPLPLFLAGGLGPGNLAAAWSAATPFAVDLNSKVEVSPGRKDLAKVRACVDILDGLAPPPP
jgi:phosphoribosylanthranilate isomerase